MASEFPSFPNFGNVAFPLPGWFPNETFGVVFQGIEMISAAIAHNAGGLQAANLRVAEQWVSSWKANGCGWHMVASFFWVGGKQETARNNQRRHVMLWDVYDDWVGVMVSTSPKT